MAGQNIDCPFPRFLYSVERATGLKHVSELIKESVVGNKWRTGTSKGTIDISLCNYFPEDLEEKFKNKRICPGIH
jgi:hypothetical protein